MKINTKLDNEINEILYNVWDPIEISDINGPKDEYTDYIQPIIDILSKDNISKEKLVDKLLEIEDYYIGCITSNRKNVENTASQLLLIKQKFNL